MRLCCTLAAVLALALLAGSVDAQDRGLFVPVSGTDRLVRLDHDLLGTARVNADTEDPAILRLPFADVALDAIIERTGPTAGGYWLSGRIDGDPLSSMTLVVNGDVVAGEVRIVGATYTIRSVGDGVHTVRRNDPGLLVNDDTLRVAASPLDTPAGVKPIRPPASAAEAPPEEEDGSRIDVMVVYTPAARAAEGGREEIEALVDLYVADTNQAYTESGVIQRLHLVAAVLIDYEETQPGPGLPGGLAGNVDLHRLVQPDDGHMDEVHDLRDRHAADIVTFIGKYDDETGGIAALCDEPRTGRRGCTPESWFAFNLLNNEASSGTYVHELGHTMGLNHDRYATTRCPRCSPAPEQDLAKWGPYPYAFGYVNQQAFETDAPESSRWVTIMAYTQQCADAGIRCSHLLRFSNPDQTYSRDPDTLGDPMGIPGDEPSPSVAGPADSRRTLNQTRHIVANYRTAPCLRDGTRISLQARSGHYLTAQNGGAGAVMANRDDVGAWERFRLDTTAAGCIQPGAGVSLQTSDGFYLRAGPDGGLDAMSTTAGPWETFTFHRRGDGTIRRGDLMALEANSGLYVVTVLGGGGTVNAGGTALIPAWETFRVGVE